MPTSALVLILVLALVSVSMPAFAIEEPAYEVVQQMGDVEVRQYPAYVVAEVVMAGSAEDSGNQAFRVLAGYIFGKNQGEKKLAMTAPVTQTPAPAKLNMTAPVMQTAVGSEFLLGFVLPKGTTVDSAPVPLDPRIVVREEPAKRVAVIRYSGFWSEANYSTHLERLENVLREKGIEWSGTPVYARYNPPFVPWFLRRNEIWLPLATGAARHPDT